MAETPSPYAPGIISNERAPTRPAGRPIVFLVAAFAAMLANSTTDWRFWIREILGDHGPPTYLASLIFTVPLLLVLLWAYLSDRVPLFGTRREGYLVVAGLIGAAAWGALGFGGAHPSVWLAAPALLGVALSVSRAAISGGLTEIGRRHGTTGVMAAGSVVLLQLASLGSVPRGVLSGLPFAWTAGVGAGLWLVIVLFVVTLGFNDGGATAPVQAPAPPVRILRFLRSRAFWAAVAVAACAGLASLPRQLLALHFRAPDSERTVSPWLWLPVIPVAAAGVYLFICRRLRFATLLRLALAVKALALVAFALVWRAGADQTTLELIAPTAADALATVALFDLAMRAAPRGWEALGFMLLWGFPWVIASMLGPLTTFLRAPVGSVAWFCAGAAVAAVAAVSLLPRAVSSASGNDGG
jgi:MFS family permease